MLHSNQNKGSASLIISKPNQYFKLQQDRSTNSEDAAYMWDNHQSVIYNTFMTAACIVGSWKMSGLIAGHMIVNVWFGAQTFVVGAIKGGGGHYFL